MRAVVQRVSRARVTVEGEEVGAVGAGLLVLVGVKQGDTPAAARYLAEKVAYLRIFADDQGKMNRSVQDVNGAVLAVSQFTLYGDVRKGRRPDYFQAARPEDAHRLYEQFCTDLRALGVSVARGRFQAHMEVELVNDGPVTILVDSERAF